MWIRRATYDLARAKHATQIAFAAHLQGELDSARRQATYDRETRAYLENENRALRERLIEAEANARTGQAQAAIWAIRTNQLQSERDQLLVRLLPGMEIRTPHVSPSGIGAVLEPPAVSFEHDPHGQAPPPDPITVPADELYPEASGVAYDPFRDVREAPPDAE
jgi:hypothetical protein